MKIKKLLISYIKMSTVRKASLWFVFSSMIVTLLSLISTPIITRLLSIDEYGVLAVFTTWESILAVIMTLKLYGGIYEVEISKDSANQNSITASLMILSLIITFLFFILYLFTQEYIYNLIGFSKKIMYLMFANIMAHNIYNFWSTSLRFKYEYKKFVLVHILMNILRIALSIILILWFSGNRVLGRILGLGLPYYIISIFLFVFIINKAEFSKITKYWKSSLKFNLVLLPHYLSSIVLSSSDRIMIERILDAKKAGIYSLAYTYSNIVIVIIGALYSAFTPHAYKLLVEKAYVELNKTTLKLMEIVIIISSLFMIIAPEIFKILAPSEFYEGVYIVPILIYGIFLTFFYSNFSFVEFMEKSNSKYITLATLSGSIVNILLNYYLLNLYGYKIAAFTTVCGYLVMATCHYLIYRKTITEKIYDVRKMASYAVGFLMFSLVVSFSYKYPILRYLFLTFLLIISIKSSKIRNWVFQLINFH